MSRPPLSRAAAGKLLADTYEDFGRRATPTSCWEAAAAALLEAAGCPLAALAELANGGHVGCHEDSCRGCRTAALLRGEGEP